MKLNMRMIAKQPYTEYTVKTGETLRQIAKTQLHDESRLPEIYRLNNSTPEIKSISETQNLTGWILLLPPVSASVLVNRPVAEKNLKEIYDLAVIQGSITAEEYYERRKLILSML